MSSVECGVVLGSYIDPLWGTMPIKVHVYKFLFESESGTVFGILLKIMAMLLHCILKSSVMSWLILSLVLNFPEVV